jgi:hypothetical protein
MSIVQRYLNMFIATEPNILYCSAYGEFYLKCIPRLSIECKKKARTPRSWYQGIGYRLYGVVLIIALVSYGKLDSCSDVLRL